MAALCFKLFWDKRAKDSGRIINHTLSAAIDGTIYAASIIIFIGYSLVSISVFFLTIILRWTLFDIAFNIINGWKWNHTGNSAWLDLFLDKIDGAKDNVAKYGIYLKSILICILLFLILYSYV